MPASRAAGVAERPVEAARTVGALAEGAGQAGAPRRATAGALFWSRTRHAEPGLWLIGELPWALHQVRTGRAGEESAASWRCGGVATTEPDPAGRPSEGVSLGR